MFCLCSHQIIAVLLHRGQYTKMLNLFMPSGGIIHIYFNCSNYNSSRGTCTSTHYIRVDFLEQVVLGEIKRLTKYAVRYEDEFLQAVIGSTQKTAELERKIKQKELASLQARDDELDGLFERIYEDNLSGNPQNIFRSPSLVLRFRIFPRFS